MVSGVSCSAAVIVIGGRCLDAARPAKSELDVDIRTTWEAKAPLCRMTSSDRPHDVVFSSRPATPYAASETEIEPHNEEGKAGMGPFGKTAEKSESRRSIPSDGPTVAGQFANQQAFLMTP